MSADFSFAVIDLATIAGALLGLGWGVIADRIAARWPAHDDGRIRPFDWRTPVVAVVGAASGWLLLERFGSQPGQLAIVGLDVLALIVLFATDLDQRLLPDVITLPLIVLAIVAFVIGLSPYVHDTSELAFAAVAAVVAPAALYLLSIPFGAGAIGRGDLKLLVSVGLLAGPFRLFLGLITGAVLASVAIVVLIAARRISVRSYVPYGPFLIVGALWSLLTNLGL
jgi:leader peptidase (prepilin peptidase)/N-methyltransferase